MVAAFESVFDQEDDAMPRIETAVNGFFALNDHNKDGVVSVDEVAESMRDLWTPVIARNIEVYRAEMARIEEETWNDDLYYAEDESSLCEAIELEQRGHANLFDTTILHPFFREKSACEESILDQALSFVF